MLMTPVKLHIVCTLTERFLGVQHTMDGVGGTCSTDDKMTVAYFVL